MSSVQDKLKNCEVVPPVQVWDKIASELDESFSAQKFPFKLYELESVPPSIVWDNINSELQDSLPANALSSRLYHAEVNPPAAAWPYINAALHPSEESATPVVSISGKRKSFLRYAVAAAFIGIAAFGIIKWTTGSVKPDTGIAGTINSAATTPQNTTPAPVAVSPENKEITSPQPANGISLTASTPKPRRYKNNDDIKEANYTYGDEDYDASNPLYAYEDHTNRIADRYIMLMTPDGKFIRMSKKWSDMVCCVSGEEQDADCKTQLKQWQEKLAASPAATSAGNFLDILSLVNSLENGGTEL